MKYPILIAALFLAACSKPHVPTLMEHCTSLERQSEADQKRAVANPDSWTRADQDRFDAGFKDYFDHCRDSSGHGIAPSAP